jgi:DNA mismatch endonuclease (patch repair protein)
MSKRSPRPLRPIAPPEPPPSAERSALMRRVRQRHTAPERIVRSVLHRLGLRFTVEGPLNRTLPGRPDIVLPRWHTVIFVHGCFWHRHEGCPRTTTPATRRDFWETKFAHNVARDRRQQRALRAAGWRVLVVWECATLRPTTLAARLARYFRAGADEQSLNPADRCEKARPADPRR